MAVSPYMPTSPDSHEIEVVEGDHEEVSARGDQITELGEAMRNSWGLIQRLVDDGADMEGAAIDKVRDVAEEVNSDLGKAGSLYLAVGPHITQYGDDLHTAQDAMRPIVSALEELWREYHQLSAAADSAGWGVPGEPAADADESDQTAYDEAQTALTEAQSAASGKKGEWDGKAAEYDREWNTWHSAFTNAATKIKEDTSGKIEDSWKDDMRGLLDFLADVLAVAGIILAVLAIIIGGPIIAALAAIVAVAALVVQILKFTVDDGNWLDLTLAIVGVVPFIGPAVKFFKNGNILAQFSDDFIRLSGQGAGSMQNWLTGLNSLKGSGFWGGTGEFVTQFISGKGADEWLGMGARGIDALDTISTIWATQLGIAGIIKGLAEGILPGAFDPDQNPFHLAA